MSLNQFYVMSQTHFSCDTVGRELWLAISNPLLCPETDWNIDIGKEGYVFILKDFKSESIKVILRLGKVEFFKQINLRNILFIESRLTKTNFVLDLVSLDCRLRAPEIFWIIF